MSSNDVLIVGLLIWLGALLLFLHTVTDSKKFYVLKTLLLFGTIICWLISLVYFISVNWLK